MHIAFALFADAANLSQEGKLNVLGVFDALHVDALPTVHPRASLVVRLKGGYDDMGTHTLTLAWVDPRGAEVWSSSGGIHVGAPPPGVAELDLPVIAAVDLPLAQAGAYVMRIAVDGEPRVEVPLQVRVGTPAMHGPVS